MERSTRTFLQQCNDTWHSDINGTALEKHSNIHGKSATTIMRMMVIKMATYDNNYYNKEENNDTNNGIKNGSKQGKKAYKCINEDKNITAEM